MLIKEELRVYSDGASRGNPGKSAIGFMTLDENRNTLKKCSKYIGIRTNNQAEYRALILALKFASELGGRDISCFMDSELVVNQLNGDYRVEDSHLKVLWRKVDKLRENFKRISFTHVPRTESHIQKVDHLVNRALNRANRSI